MNRQGEQMAAQLLGRDNLRAVFEDELLRLVMVAAARPEQDLSLWNAALTDMQRMGVTHAWAVVLHTKEAV